MENIRYLYEQGCSTYYMRSPLVDIMLTTSVISFIVPFLLLFASFWRKELYTLFFSIASFINLLLNTALRDWIFMDPVPRGGCTILEYGMPSLELQQAFFVVVFVMGYVTCWEKNAFASIWRRLLLLANLYAYSVLVVTSQVFLGGNTAMQAIIGAVVGTLMAHITQLIIFRLLFPRFDVIRRWKFIRLLGYADTLSIDILNDPSSKESVVVVSRKPAFPPSDIRLDDRHHYYDLADFTGGKGNIWMDERERRNE